jgi:NADH-ubiquinone oxidoreductase chain 4L
MYFPIILFILGLLGFIFNKKNLILMLVSLELILLAIILFLLLITQHMDMITPQIIAIYIIAVAGAESAIGLAIFVSYYKIRGTVHLDNTSYHKIRGTVVLKNENFNLCI